MALDPDTDKRIRQALDEIVGYYLFWKMRDVSGRFAKKIRVTIYFEGDQPAAPHIYEIEGAWPQKMLNEAEQHWLVYEKKMMVEDAARALLTGRLEDDDERQDDDPMI